MQLRRFGLVLTAAWMLAACKGGARSKDAGAPTADPAPAASTVTAAPTELTFTVKNRAVGSTWDESATTQTQISLTKPKKLENTEISKDSAKFEVLAADGAKLLKVKVTYKEKVQTVSADGKDKTKTHPAQGNSYLAEFKDGKVVVTDENKKKVSAEEQKAVSSDVRGFLGKPDPILAGIPGVPVKVGGAANSIAEALRERLGNGESQVELTGVSATLKSITSVADHKTGTFDVKMKATVKEGAFKIMMDISGTVVIRADTGHLTQMSLAAPITLTGGGADGTGSMSINASSVD